MRRLRVFFSLPQWRDDELEGQTAVVIDVLRATTTLAVALHNGARRIIPAESPAAATDIKIRVGKENVILGGEKEGRIIPGFDLGNSPAEYTPEKVAGKNLVFVSTNGTRAVIKTRLAERSLLGSMVNAGLVAEFLARNPGDTTFICAGREDKFSIEDAVCAGIIVNRLLAQTGGGEIHLNDAARVASLLGERYASGILELFRHSDHGRYLMNIGQEADLEFCARLDSLPVIPVFQEEHITQLSF